MPRPCVRSALATGLVLALYALAFAAPALAQTVRDKMLTENPNRTPGGSCIYGGDGKLLHSPRGVRCPETEEPPASIAPEAAPRPPVAAAKRASASEHSAGVSNAEAAALLAEREQMTGELARVREALGYEDREAARRVAEESLVRIEHHLEREARMLQLLITANP